MACYPICWSLAIHLLAAVHLLFLPLRLPRLMVLLLVVLLLAVLLLASMHVSLAP
jgi:hypothetical protein